MALRPLRPCKRIGCPELVSDGYCNTHKIVVQTISNRDKPEYVRLYKSKRWRDSRLQYLANDPLCVMCDKDGRLTPATIVDHIRDHKGDVVLFWDVSNWQSLCARCHNSKTAKENNKYK